MSFDFVIFLLAWAIPKYRTNESRVNRCQAESNSQACLAMPRREGGRRSQACLNIAEARRRKTKSSLLGSYIAVTAGGRMGSSGTSSIGTATQGYYLGSSPSSYYSATTIPSATPLARQSAHISLPATSQTPSVSSQPRILARAVYLSSLVQPNPPHGILMSMMYSSSTRLSSPAVLQPPSRPSNRGHMWRDATEKQKGQYEGKELLF